MKTIIVKVAVASLFFAGCVTELTPEQKRDHGLEVLQQVSTAEAIIETAVKYECPEVTAEAEKKLANVIDELIICGAKDGLVVKNTGDFWRGGYDNLLRCMDEEEKMRIGRSLPVIAQASNQRHQRIKKYIAEEQGKFFHPQGQSSGDIALEREKKFYEIARILGDAVMLNHPERLNAEKIEKLYEGWNIGDDITRVCHLP